MARKLKVIDLTTADNTNANQQVTETQTENLMMIHMTKIWQLKQLKKLNLEREHPEV